MRYLIILLPLIAFAGCGGPFESNSDSAQRHISVSQFCANHRGVKDVRDVIPDGGGWGTAIICRDGFATIARGGVRP